MPFALARRGVVRRLRIASLCSVSLLLGLNLTAQAADMPMPGMPAKAPPVPAYNWSGCYAGINGGGAGASSNFTSAAGAGSWLSGDDPGEVSNDGTLSTNSSNFMVGGQLGCNWQSGTYVVGLEGDLDYFPSNTSLYNDSNTLPTSGNSFVVGQQIKTNYLSTIRPRAGIAADRNFFYVTGGAAFTTASYTESYTDSGGGTGSATASKFLAGWTVGAGWEYAWATNATFRVEYLFVSFPTMGASGVINGPGGTTNPLQGSADLTLQVVRAGLNYKF